MPTNYFNRIFSIIFFITMLLNLPTMIMSDDTCPYPCYPSPNGGTPTGTIPSPPASQSGSYPSPPTTGNLPYYPPPPYGNNYFGVSPPPPDPILPYFPYYYREPLHQRSLAAGLPRSNLMIVSSNVVGLVFLLGLWHL